jgi:hypothetical protein
MNKELQAFHAQLIASAQKEREAGRLTMSQTLLIRSLRLRPVKLQQVYEECVNELCSDTDFVATLVSNSPPGSLQAGSITLSGDALAKSILAGEFKVDWEKLGDFIVKILPAILQIIALFL